MDAPGTLGERKKKRCRVFLYMITIKLIAVFQNRYITQVVSLSPYFQIFLVFSTSEYSRD